MDGAHHALRIDGDGCGFGNATGDPQALVIAPLPLLFAGKWDGNQQVYAVEKSGGTEFVGQYLAQECAHFRAVVVFQGEKEMAVDRGFGVAEEGCAFADRDEPPEHAGDGVVFERVGPDAWQA